MDTWLNELQTNIQNIRSGKLRVAETTTPSNDGIGSALVILIVLFAVCLGAAYLYKVKEWPFNDVAAGQYSILPKTPEPLVTKKEFDETIKNQNDRITRVSDRLTLKAAVDTNNFVALQNDLKDKLVFFNVDWTIGKMPEHIQITEAQRVFLQKFIKP